MTDGHDPALDAPPRAAVRWPALRPPCPVDRLSRRRRNQICIWIVTLGALNLLVYPVVYAGLGGDAHNGYRKVVRTPDGGVRSVYYLRGHHLRSLAGREREVSRAVWVFSYLHSISLLLTSGAMIVAMLVLARPHILATMRDGLVRGETFVTVLGTVVVLVTLVAVVQFTWSFVAQLMPPGS